MTSTVTRNAAKDPGFFDGRYLIAIRWWDWSLYVGQSHPLSPPEHRFQGGLLYSRSVEIEGEVIAPSAYRGKILRVWISPFGVERVFEPDRPWVGCFYFRHREAGPDGLSLSLDLPENALGSSVTCLGSTWKYLHVWLDEPDHDQAGVRAFSFSSSIHENLKAWAEADESHLS